MIPDVLLREAAAEAEEFLLSHLPETQQPHVFSKRFERKIKKLISRAKHPVRYQVMRYAAAVLLAIMTLFGAVLAVSPEARAAVIGWVRSTFYEFFEYSNGSNDPSTAGYDYILRNDPDGYTQLNTIEKENGKIYLYVSDSGDILQFTYTHGASSDGLFIEAENYILSSASINGLAADIYIAKNENESSVIVWQSEEEKVLFHILANADSEALIKLAESVEKKK